MQTLIEPEWKDTDPPFMRAVWESEAPEPEPSAMERRMRRWRASQG